MIWRGEYRLNILIKVCEIIKINYSEIYDNLQWINYRGITSKGSKSSLQMKLPKNFEDFYYLTGLFYGDGDTDGNRQIDNFDIANILTSNSFGAGSGLWDWTEGNFNGDDVVDNFDIVEILNTNLFLH